MIDHNNLLRHGNLLRKRRSGCKDVWNAFMVNGAQFSSHDIPLCPTFLPNGMPADLISFPEAKTIYNKAMKTGKTNFHYDAFVHFYCDDHLFDSAKSSIWTSPNKILPILKSFSGIITPDFSTYADFPDPIKRYNTYRMRAFGFWCVTNNIPVINNVRWGTSETWSYCFDGIARNSVVCIGSIASGLRDLENQADFTLGLQEMINTLSPKTVLIYGSAKYTALNALYQSHIEIISFMSHTNKAFHYKKGGTPNE